MSPRAGPQRGFTLLELVVATAVFAILAGVLLDRLLYYQAMAERANMQAVLVNLRVALKVEMAKLMIHGRSAEYSALTRANPMEWVDSRPPNYRGDYPRGQDTPRLDGWYFDQDRHQLVYAAKNRKMLELEGSPGPELRYHVRLSEKTAGPASIGLELVPVKRGST